MFAKQIKLLRKKNNLTQTDLARDFGLTQQAVAKWEAGLSFPDAQILADLASYFEVTTDFLLGIDNTSRRKLSLVPVLGSVKAGYNSLAFEDYQGEELADVSDPENYCYFVVKGDSMAPYIREGDLALIRRQSVLNDGDLGVIINEDGEGTLKKFHRRGDEVLLEPFNKDYQTLRLSGEELNSLFILGKVVETKTRW